MSSVAAGKRSWKCPDCGGEVLLSITQLDPMACDACLERMRGGKVATGQEANLGPAGPLGIWQSLPEMTKLAIVAVAFVGGLLLGLTLGFFAGKSTVPAAVSHGKQAPGQSAPVIVEKEEERPEPPGPGYKWVRGRERKDGTRGPGHWAKDPFYKGSDGPSSKKNE